LPTSVGSHTKKRKRKKVDSETKEKRRADTARQRAAKESNLSDNTLRKYQYVMQHSSPERIKAMKNRSINEAYNLEKRDEQRAELLKSKPVLKVAT
jgi:hypothetical protein